MVQKSKQLELAFEKRGEALKVERSGQMASATRTRKVPGGGLLMDRVLSRANMQRALKRVKRNKGSAGVDGMSVDELGPWLVGHWLEIRAEIESGRYRPSPVRHLTIPKRGGGERMLGIPTVLDRLIQQALLQVLSARFDGGFSEHSYGFRPGRSAHGAIRQAQTYIQNGKRWVVDVDLEKFFDRVNHDVLMGKLAKRIDDRSVLALIRRYLVAGVMANGVVMERHEGTPQGGPLSPLLANVLLDDIDKELELRGHEFVRYADDLRVFVGSKKSGDRVMNSLIKLFGKLRLQVNESKSAVDRVWRRPFLGFSFWMAPGRRVKMTVAPKAQAAMKSRVRQLTRRSRGRSLEQIATELRAYLIGWKGYFRLAKTPKVFLRHDQWIRHRLRCFQLKQWKRGTTAFRELRKRGASVELAAKIAGNTKRWWRNSGMAIHIALPNSLFDGLGVPRLAT
jgi:RNA-directed DNA polymerase